MRRDRKQILRSFEAWLDRVLAEEEPPEGLPSEILARLSTESPHSTEGSCDLYSMWSQMTALVQEVKLQGRSFKQLSDAVAPVADLAPRLVELEREAQTKARREVLEMFLDLRDRMVRGLETARKSLVRLEGLSPRGWRRKMLGRESLRETARETAVALEKGYALSLDRLDEVLHQLEVTEIPCQGRPFDPGICRQWTWRRLTKFPKARWWRSIALATNGRVRPFVWPKSRSPGPRLARPPGSKSPATQAVNTMLDARLG